MPHDHGVVIARPERARDTVHRAISLIGPRLA
jgi:hypothetical protein